MSWINSFYNRILSVNGRVLSLTFIVVIVVFAHKGFACKIRNKQYHFKITIPKTMRPVHFVNDTPQNGIYYDSVIGVTLMISGRESKFYGVDEYVNCNWKELENILRDCIGDTSLRIVSCNKTHKMTILNFTVNASIDGCRNNIIYFIHHRKKDIQFWFASKDEFNIKEQVYTTNIMHTLKLK